MSNTPVLNIIRIKDFPWAEFRVAVEEGRSHTTHTVTLSREYLGSLTGAETEVSAEEVVRRAFVFLLEREPKESILAEFDLSDIQSYFPEFPDQIKTELAKNE